MPAGDVVRCLLNKNIPMILHMQRFKNFIQICKFSIKTLLLMRLLKQCDYDAVKYKLWIIVVISMWCCNHTSHAQMWTRTMTICNAATTTAHLYHNFVLTFKNCVNELEIRRNCAADAWNSINYWMLFFHSNSMNLMAKF